MSKVSVKPQTAPAFDPNTPRYWDERDLEQELTRQFEACHGCRMCVNYCGAFPDLFARVDRDIETRGAEGSERLDNADFRSITELCWQCKLCYIDCPYTSDQGHEWVLDIPRLLMREKLVRARRDGVTLQEKFLGEPGRLGAMSAGPMAPLVNWVNEQALFRKVNAKALGISEKFPLPAFAPQKFETWLDKHKPDREAGKRGTVAIFATCLADYNFPEIAKSAVRVLERNGFEVVRPSQECCGIPNLDGGDLESAKAKARFNVQSLLPMVEAGHAVVVPGPSCSYTIRKEYPELLGTAEAKLVANRTFDLMDFLDKLDRKGEMNREFVSPSEGFSGFGKVAYHAACHLRAQKIGTPGARLLGLLPDTEVEIVAKCSAVDGTWGMKEQYYEMGKKYAQKLKRGIENAEAELVVTDCPLSGRRILQETGSAPKHPIEALAEAYGFKSEAP